MLIAFLIRCALVQICREGAVLWEGGLPTDCMLIALPHCMLTSRASACGLWAGAHPSCGAAATRALWNPMIENALLPSPPLAYVQTKPASEQLGDANTARLEDERRYAQYDAVQGGAAAVRAARRRELLPYGGVCGEAEARQAIEDECVR